MPTSVPTVESNCISAGVSAGVLDSVGLASRDGVGNEVILDLSIKSSLEPFVRSARLGRSTGVDATLRILRGELRGVNRLDIALSYGGGRSSSGPR